VTSRRGRRDNGLDASLWSPVRDVDPRIGEHLLDLLHAVGIAAYLEPSADVEPYTRSVSLPSPPSDRLYVDRARRAEARTVVDAHVPAAAESTDGSGPHEQRAEPARSPERAVVRRDLDEEAEWAAIVSAFEAENGRNVVEDPPAVVPPPTPHEIPILDRPDEHFEPPPPPPLPVPTPASLYAVLLIALGVLLIGAPGVLRLSSDVGLILGVASIAGGAAMLVSRMRDRSEDDGDDGAVV
jgi:hypothetical protein